MPSSTLAMDANTLRDRLMAREPMPRFTALHAIEAEIEQQLGGSPSQVALANAAARFVERGIPYYSVDGSHYQAWVSKAVTFWEKLRQH